MEGKGGSSGIFFHRNSVERHVVDKDPGVFEWKEFKSIGYDMIMIILQHKWSKPRGLLYSYHKNPVACLKVVSVSIPVFPLFGTIFNLQAI